MKLAIMGAGGVGGYIGAKLLLSNDKNDITLIARGSHLEKIKKDGLTLIDNGIKQTVKPGHIAEDTKGLGIFDLVIFCTKAYDLENAANKLKNNIDKNTIILPLLNGVENDKNLKNILPEAKVCNGCVYILSNITKPGIVEKKSDVFMLFFGSDQIPIKDLQKLESLFTIAELRNKLSEDIEFQTWRKYLFISTFAALTSYFDITIGKVLKSHRGVLNSLLEEIVLVANAKGIPLNNKNIEKSIEQAENIPYDSQTSMQLDIEKGKNNEVESLCGYIVKEAEKLDIHVPIMQKIYEGLC